MYKICFYVPESHVEQVKNAMLAKGAGKIGNYSHCAWQVLGTGQFLPIEESHPYIGKKDRIEILAEYKVELVCDNEHIKNVIAAMKETHPYEEVAYQVLKVEDF